MLDTLTTLYKQPSSPSPPPPLTSSWKDLKFRINQFPDYSATHPNSKIGYHSSQMNLWIHSYASYPNASKACSRNGGFFYLSDKPKLPIKPNDPPPKLNAPVPVNSKIIDTVMYSVQKSETGSGFINGKDDVPLHNALHEMDHIQVPTPIQFENIVVNGIITDTVVQRISKAMDMHFYWLRDRCRQKQFHVHWKQGKHNLADYPSKHHSTKHHISVRPTYVLNTIQKQTRTLFKLPTTLQGSVQTHLPLTVK